MKYGYFIWLTITLLWTGCARAVEDPPIGHGEKGRVFFSATIPSLTVPKSRSMDGYQESKVETIDLLVFDQTGLLVLNEKISASDLIQDHIESTQYKFSFNFEIPALPNARTVAFVANASAQVDAAISSAPSPKMKSDILSRLTFSKTGKWHDEMNPSAYTAIPMFGEIAVAGISPGTAVPSIELVRMLARIDVKNNSGITVNRIYLVNYNTAGSIASLGGDPTANENPVLPSSPGKQTGQNTALAYQPSGMNPQALEGIIYTFESHKAAGKDTETGHRDAICIILECTYNNSTHFYRVDFSNPAIGSNPSPEEIEYMPVYRNHQYTFEIIKAEGNGYTSFDEALNAYGVLSNLKTRLHVLNLTGYKYMVYNGQYYLGVEDRNVEVPWGKGKTIELPLVTDFSGAWNASMIDISQSWLRFPGGQTQLSGFGLDQLSSLKFNVAALNSYSTPSARILLTAGRLQMMLTVKRTPITPLFARSNVVANGNSAYSRRLVFAVTEEENETIPANSQGLLFKWGSLIGLSPVTNPYNPGIHVIFNPTNDSPSGWGGGLDGWDKIPYAHTKFGFPRSTVFNDDHNDEFDGYNTTGFNAADGIGDICRYISTPTGSRDAWVEGEWRMPTFGDLQMLMAETQANAPGGLFANMTATVTGTTDNHNGLLIIPNGWWYGMNVTSSFPARTDANMAKPPAGTLFWPVSGHRYPNGDGDVVHIGTYGYYWSATPYDAITVNYILSDKYATTDYDADRSYAFPVRCIRNY